MGQYQTDSVADAVSAMTKWPEQWSADMGAGSMMDGISLRPHAVKTESVRSSHATATTSLWKDKKKVVLVEISKSGVNQYVLIRVTCSPAPCGYDDATGQQCVPLSALSAPFELTETSSRHYRDLVLHLQICDGVCAHLRMQVKKKLNSKWNCGFKSM